MIKLMGGREAFSTFSIKERNKIWQKIFERSSGPITAGFLSTCHRYIDLDNIFNGQTSPRREAWRRCFQWTFIQCCVSTVENNLDKPLDRHGITQYYADFKALPTHPDLEPIRSLVDALEESPVKLGGMLDLGWY